MYTSISTVLRHCFVALLCGGLWQASAMAQGIEFEHGSWEEVLEKAEQEEKPIFVDAYATWCGPCKWMAKEVFTQEAVGDYINNHFIAYKMDMEKGDGPAFAAANKVQAYPTLLYFDSKGELLHKAAGARDADGLLQLSMDALSPEKQLGRYISRFDNGERDKAFLTDYLEMLMESGEDVSIPFSLYWKQLDEEERQTEDVLLLMAMSSSYFSNINDPLTQYLIEHRTAYEDLVGAKSVRRLLWRTYTQSAAIMTTTINEDKANSIRTQLLTLFPEAKKDLKYRLKLYEIAQEDSENEVRVEKAYARYLKHTVDPYDLNDAAWTVYEDTKATSKDLKQGLVWANRSIALNEDFSAYDTKGALLYRMGQYEEAKAALKHSIALAEEEEIDESYLENTRALLSQIEAMN